ncbi:hypothetical protein N7466_003498 [Penicillium verhagenii]|uniref:uncharacterized protein n=1 Tax=Penicillium verhagenii TaxID=1562060 RepID=UPI002545B324|nr:uncharacterized protein N7466_003498 [Penicillium verhagenii]KAJ5937048.1 hypothetical protein N7466_003498 [Penicillium verhagenii]
MPGLYADSVVDVGNVEASDKTRTQINFPSDPFFTKLLARAKQRGDSTIISDNTISAQVSYRQLLQDVDNLRQSLRRRLSPGLLDVNGTLNNGTCIAVIARSGYRFIVASIAIFALGGIILPLSPGYLAEEALHFLQKCKAVAILYDPDSAVSELARSIVNAQSNDLEHQVLPQIPIRIDPSSSLQQTLSFASVNTTAISPDRPALYLLTSGTTGTPKVVVHSRRIFNAQPEPNYDAEDVFLSNRAFFWVGGFRELIGVLLRGVRVELIDYKSNADAIWKRISRGDITRASFLPSVFSNMIKLWEEKIALLPDHERRPYADAACRLRGVKYAGGLVPSSIKRSWKTLLPEVRVEVEYGASEFGMASFSCCIDGEDTIESHYLGRPLPGVTFKLGDDQSDMGELLVKTPTQFTSYLDGPEATNTKIDENGFFRTGDLGRRAEDGRIIIEGRVTPDFIRYRGLRVPILEVEENLLALPYISEAYVVPILDVFAGGSQVAAVVRFRKDHTNNTAASSPSLHAIRAELSSSLPDFKLPTLLRILTDGEDIPRSQAGKPAPRDIATVFFPQPDEGVLNGLPDDVQFCNTATKDGPVAWGLGAMRC